MKARIFIALCLLACSSYGQNHLWSSPTYGKVDPREWMPESIYTNCVLWMPMNANPTQFATWTTPSGTMGNHGIQTNSNMRPQQAPNGMTFDGVDDNIRLANYLSQVSFNKNCSLSAWCYGYSYNTSNAIAGRNHIVYTVGPNAGDRVLIRWGAGNTSTSTRGFGIDSYDGTSTRSVGRIFTPTTGVWYHVVGTVNSSKALKFYLNGVNYADATSYHGGDASVGFSVGGDTAALFGFNGIINDVTVFAVELSQAQVTTLYNAQKGRHP